MIRLWYLIEFWTDSLITCLILFCHSSMIFDLHQQWMSVVILSRTGFIERIIWLWKHFLYFLFFLAINCKHKSGSIFFSEIEFLRHFQPASVIELDLKMKIMILFESFGLLFIVYDNVAFLSQCRSLVFSFIERTLYRTSHRKWVAGESSHLATDKHWLVWEKKLTADDGNFLISSQSIKSEI